VAWDVAAGSRTPPRWVADEMLGRLARYLRFLGHDTIYVRGLDDDAVRRLATADGRVLLTRDRELARRTDSAVLLHAVDVVEQLREVRRAFPGLPHEVTFDRCPECNARLRAWEAPVDPAGWPPVLPRPSQGLLPPVWECPACGRHYWEGSHAPRIRALVAGAWDEEGIG
jgi:uncharacterized protein with PIN domain